MSRCAAAHRTLAPQEHRGMLLDVLDAEDMSRLWVLVRVLVPSYGCGSSACMLRSFRLCKR
jgi:hypothetical protein